ncbi:MAG: GntR family transcriptional regulator [Mogibacterium sp.]|nr:GntR family transcriptional regulator [Mogibacterium sp.]
MNLVRKPVKEQVYDIIKSRILEGEIELGERINILTLSKEFNVSNSPIREALSMLERDGLIEITPNAGYRVLTFSQELFFSIEQSVKALLYGSYALTMDLGRQDVLIEMLEQALEAQTAVYKDCERHKYVRLSMRFDASFVRATGNAHLNKMYDEIENIFYLVVLYDYSFLEGERLPIIEEHRQILNAVKAGDHTRVGELIEKHYSRIPPIVAR